MKEYSIPCRHETDQVGLTMAVNNYHPLTRTEFDHLIERAAQEKDPSTLVSIHVRLMQAIPGSVCPEETNGPAAQKHADLDQALCQALEDLRRGTGSADVIWSIINLN